MDVIKTQLAITNEAEEGTAETLTAADALLVSSPKFTPDIKMNESKAVTGSASPSANRPGARSAKMTFDVELAGAAAAGTAPPWAPAMLACRALETTVAVTSVTYSPNPDQGPSATMAMYLDGKIYKMWGARGTWKLKAANVGEPVMISFEFTGADWSEEDGALLVPTYSTVVPPAFQGVTMSLDSHEGVFGSLDIDAGQTVALRGSAGADSGYLSARVTGQRKAMLRLDPENVLKATKDFMGSWKSGALVPMSCALGATAGNIFTITAPKAQYQKIGLGEKNGISTLAIESLLTRNAGNDEWKIAIT